MDRSDSLDLYYNYVLQYFVLQFLKCGKYFKYSKEWCSVKTMTLERVNNAVPVSGVQYQC